MSITQDQNLLLFRMKFDLLFANHNCRTDVNSREWIDKMSVFYEAYKNYLYGSRSLENIIKAGIL